jgi:Alpha/beta hydrolase domain containing 18
VLLQNFANVAFQLGQRFAQNYQVSISNMETIQKEYYASPLKNLANAQGEKRQAVSVGSSGVAGYQTGNTSRSAGGNGLSCRSDVDGAVIPEWLMNLSRSQSLPCDSVLHFMRGIMDECTHIGNFTKPVDTSLVILVVAKSDAYVPRNSVKGVDELWPGAEVRYIDSGHISAYLFKQSVFRYCLFIGF